MAVIAAIAARTRILIRFRSPFDSPPNTPMIMSWASFAGSIGPPTSGTHSGTPKCSNSGNVRLY
ncbi:hypothetical protein D3C83_196800 [compost metagenome]